MLQLSRDVLERRGSVVRYTPRGVGGPVFWRTRRVTGEVEQGLKMLSRCQPKWRTQNQDEQRATRPAGRRKKEVDDDVVVVVVVWRARLMVEIRECDFPSKVHGLCGLEALTTLVRPFIPWFFKSLPTQSTFHIWLSVAQYCVEGLLDSQRSFTKC